MKTLFFSAAALFLLCQAASAQQCSDLNSLKPVAASFSAIKTALSFASDKVSIAAEDLNEFDFKLSTYQVAKDGKITPLVGSIIDTSLDYKTIYAFNQYKTAADKKRYGVSIRLVIDYRSREAGISLPNFFGALGFGGNYKKIDGDISLSVHGMKNPKAAYVLPVPTKLDDNSATQYLNYMSLLKAMVSEQNSIDPVELPSCM